MKKTMLLLAIVAITSVFTSSCETNQRKHEKHVSVHSYKVANDLADALDDVFTYIIDDASSKTCYYTTSKTPITNFSNVQWSKSEKTLEQMKEEMENEENMEDMEMSLEELPAEMQTEVADEATESEADSSSDSDGGSDSGSDSGSGGDGGGGDGGGGGGD